MITFNVKMVKSGSSPKEMEEKIRRCQQPALLAAGQQVARDISSRIRSGGVQGPGKVYPNGMPLLMETGALAGSFVAVMQGANTVGVGSMHTAGGLNNPSIEYHEFLARRIPRRAAVRPTYEEDMQKINQIFETRMNACLGGSL